MKNIHILPTEKLTNLYIFESKLEFSKSPQLVNCRNIYITNDEKFIRDEYVTDGIEVIKATPKLVDAQGLVNRRSWKKIILTTDQDLIKDGVQAIDDKFLEWFVKNPSCESVEITEDSFFGYRPILKLKQATLVEAAMNWDYLSFEAGVKWQSQTMFTSEDMIAFAEFVATYRDKNVNVHGQMLHAKSKYDGSERTIDLLEEFKKK